MKRTRGTLALLLSTAGVAAIALTAAGPSQAKTPSLIHSSRVESVSCVPAAGGTVRANVKLWMRVVNYHNLKGTDWATHMTAKVRLEATTPGWNYSRVWKGTETPYLIQDKKHTYNWNLNSDNLSPNADWQVHVKLIWDRNAPVTNVVKDFFLPFNGNCVDGSGGLVIGRGGR